MNNKQKLRTIYLVPGQVLAEDIHDRTGRLLMPAGLPLKERHLRVLMTWGVTEVTIWTETQPDNDEQPGHSDADPATPVLDPALRSRLAPVADDLFRHCDMSLPVSQTLYEASLRRIAAEAGRNKGSP
ncbi:hypothetical protein [Thioalkalivibrio sulfidiphilus]|uniref:Uncharacterized protein n=1 Tax=Thioalkalivibrio sulfidiphilus (strain HL-EbGR7) TaxID=396588 RepID=B8GSM2_THISH|nr:hypothetical protein [Thioalkalivibrio sulfidiphilus]ACL72926.1 hypothetical protein Tgr7_1845 [Thioalkalivibrio sulfidiphilus HL-EbGr7]